MYSIIFIAMYLLRSSPLQRCVLTLDDVMLQVQRIYVNIGSRREGGLGWGREGEGRRSWGWGGGDVQAVASVVRFSAWFLFTRKNENAIMQTFLTDCTGWTGG